MKVGIYDRAPPFGHPYPKSLTECTHSAHADLLRNVLRLVNVDLVKVRVGVLLGELLEDGRDHPARAAPRRPEVENGGTVAVDL